MKQKKSIPVTQRMLYGVRDELKSDIKGLESKFDGKFNSIDSRFHELSSQIHQITILAEEQNSRNIIVMDGLVNLFERQERLESKNS